MAAKKETAAKVLIPLSSVDFGREDLNNLAHKLNEVIEFIKNQ